MNVLPGVKAYIEAITYKYKIETNANILNLDQVIGIHYPQLLSQPWPRSFTYRLEFYTGDNPPSRVKHQILNFLQTEPEEHIINVFSEKLNQLIPSYRDYGYQHAWTNIMMNRKLSPSEKINRAAGVEIKPIKNIQDVALVNTIEPDYPCSTNGLDDPGIYNLMAFYKGEVCAKAQMITTEGKFAYIADIFTHPNFRRRGISTSLLQEMHQIAIASGKSSSVLIPSKMTREFDLFQKLDYHSLIEIALLVPDQKPTRE
jgi:GNAT superfamily N-acetyltransferase